MDASPSRSKPQSLRLRARLLVRGYTLRSFATKHGYKLSTVKAAIRGVRSGPTSKEIVESIRSIT